MTGQRPDPSRGAPADTFALIAAERIRLADALGQLGSADWDRPSRCAGWSVHLVAAHLNAPWEVSLPSTAWAIVRSGGIHRGFDRIARAEVHGQLIAQARDEALRIMRDNPGLRGPEGEALRCLLYLFERDEAIPLIGAG